MLYQKQFSFGILVVRRKKMQKGCRIREKLQKKVKQEAVLTEIAFVSQ